MKNKSSIINILILTIILISTVSIIAVADPIDDPVVVSAEAPNTVSVGDIFEVTISIADVENFNAATFFVTFDPALINFSNVTKGVIGGKTLDHCEAGFYNGNSDTIGIIAYYYLSSSSGEGYIAKINFKAISSGICYINLSNGQLSNFIPGQIPLAIPAEWINDSVVIQDIYTITASAGPGGNINPSGAIPVNHGEDKTFTITPNTGYHITNVLVDGVSQGAISSYTFYNIVASHTITASFAINQYELTINIEGQGTTNPGEGTYEYDEGYSVRITATPSEGYLFSHWTGDVTGSDNPIIVIMNSDKTVTAQFTPENQEYILTINTVGEGTLTKDPDLATYTNGTNVTLTATPNDNNHIFHHWTGDTTGYNNPATITMNSDKTITAVFTLRGDVNCDGTVGAADITYVQQIILGDLTNIPAADVNQDGNFDILDITAIEIIFLS